MLDALDGGSFNGSLLAGGTFTGDVLAGGSFAGIWVPLVTPFHQGAVDHPALQRLVRHLAAQGVAGFVACGSTGEAAMLDDAEQDAVLASVLAASAVMAGLLVLAGLGYATLSRVLLAKEVAVLAVCGAGGLVYAVCLVLFRAVSPADLKAALKRETGASDGTPPPTGLD